MAGTGTRPTVQVLNVPNLDAYVVLRSSQFLQRLASSTCRCSLRAKQLPTAISVAAPERNYLVASEAPIRPLNHQHKDVSKLSTCMLSEVPGDSPQQQVDAPSSPPSTSGRADVQDQPFLPGSRRRQRNHPSRRNLSSASFYGEYCDMKATQRIVSTIWERLMSQGNSSGTPTSGVIDGDVNPSLSSPLAASPCSSSLPQSDRATIEPLAIGTSSSIAAELQSRPDIVNEVITSSGMPACQTSPSVGRTSPASPLPDGWSVAAAAAADGGDGTAKTIYSLSPREPLPSTSTHPHSSPHMRVVLYLGPEFELELPPPSFGAAPFVGTSWSDAAGSDYGKDAGPPWSLSEQELRDSVQDSKPRRVRGCRLSTPEVVREVSFGNTTDTAVAPVVAKAADSKRTRGRTPNSRPDIKASAVGSSPSSSATVRVMEHRNGGREMAEGRRKVGKEDSPSRSQDRSLRLRTPAAAAAAVAVAADDGSSSTRHKFSTQAVAAAVTATTAASPVDTNTANTKARGTHTPGRSFGSSSNELLTGSSRHGTTEGPSALHRPEFSSEPRQAARQRDLLEALVERMSDAVVTARIQKLATLNRSGITALNFVVQALGEMGHVFALSRLLTLQVALGLYNEHTYGTAFRALHRAGRLAMVLAAFQEACRAGRDLGPVACSVLLHIASVERNLKLAWQLFDQMVAHKMTLNRYSYNCMAHIAALNGALDDVRLIYSMMKAEAASGGGDAADCAAAKLREDCRPDSYTYSALVRAAVNAGRGEMLPMMFNEVVAAQRAEDRAVGRIRPLMPGEGEGRVSREVWGHFICAAFRTGQSDLALRFFVAGIYELGLLPNREVYNIVLAGLAKTRPLPELLRLYSEMVNGCVRARPLGGSSGADCTHGDTVVQGRAGNSGGESSGGGGDGELPPGSVLQPRLAPDHYTFNALLTAAAHHMADLHTVGRIRKEMATHGIGLNTFIGTSLINAYRRTPELSRAAAAVAASRAAAQGPAAAAELPQDAAAVIDHVVTAAAAVMSELVRSGAANAMSYSCMAAFYAMAQKPAEAADCIRQMTTRGLLVEDSVWQFLLVTAEDAGQFGLMRVFEKERDRHMAERHVRQLQQQRQRAARQAEGAPPPPPLPGLEAAPLVESR